MKTYQRIIKRIMDIALSLFALALFAPLMLLIALLIKLDSRGPAIFTHFRVGKGGKHFVCYKFRTKHVNAPDTRLQDGSTYNAEDDPRVTRVGRFLRKTTLKNCLSLLNC